MSYCSHFTPLESPGFYAGDAINRKHQLLVKGHDARPHLIIAIQNLGQKPSFLFSLSFGIDIQLCFPYIQLIMAAIQQGWSHPLSAGFQGDS
jgi:hypothetical protein